MKLEEMNKDERSLLLFLETRAVDYGGRVNGQHMNADDYQIAKRWNETGFIKFGRIRFKDVNRDGADWVFLSEEAWELARQERRARAERMWLKKSWLSTEDNKDLYGIAGVRMGVHNHQED